MKRSAFLILAMMVWGCDFGTPTGGGGGTGAEGLTGIVVDVRGMPVSGAQVRLHLEADLVLARAALGTAIDSTVTNAFGRYGFTGLASGRYALTVRHAGGDTVKVALVPVFEFDSIADLGADTLRAAGHATAHVKAHSGEPLVGAVCGLVGTPWRATSDDAGVCHFEDVVAGTYKMKVTAPGREPGLVPIVVSPGHAGDSSHVVLQHPVAPVNDWISASVRGYALNLPTVPVYIAEQPNPIADLVYEGVTYGLVSYDPLQIETQWVSTHPGFRQEFLKVGDTAWGILTAYRLPDSLCLPGQEWIYESILRVEGRLHLVVASDSIGLVNAWRILRSVQEWQGPGPAPVVPPVMPRLVSPEDGALTADTVRFSWESPSGTTSVDSYRLQISVDSTFSQLVVEDTVAAAREDVSVILNRLIGPLTPGQTFYWRVVAIGPGGSTVSERRSFQTGDPSPVLILD